MNDAPGAPPLRLAYGLAFEDLYRLDGPARIERDPVSGIVTKECWFVEGEEIEAPGARQGEADRG